MSIEMMRSQLMDVYPYPRWHQKVANMHERQVVAIYKSLERQNALYPHRKNIKLKESGHQISIWEWMQTNE